MKAGIITKAIKDFKNNAAKYQMYELGANLRDLEIELSYNYTFEDEIDISHFTSLLQRCLTGVPDEQKSLLIPIKPNIAIINLVIVAIFF